MLILSSDTDVSSELDALAQIATVNLTNMYAERILKTKIYVNVARHLR